MVRAYLDGELVGQAGANTPSKIIEFPIVQKSHLELRDEGQNSVIKFTNFQMVPCSNDSTLQKGKLHS